MGFNTFQMIKLGSTTWISGNLRGSDDGLRTKNGHALRQHRVTVLHDYLHSQPEQCKVLRFQAAQLWSTLSSGFHIYLGIYFWGWTVYYHHIWYLCYNRNMKPIGIISSDVPATSIRKWPFSEGGTSSEGSRGGGEDLVRLSLQDAGGNPKKRRVI